MRQPAVYYARLERMINEMESGETPITVELLDDLQGVLVFGRDFEELIPEGVEVVQALYNEAQGKLDALRIKLARGKVKQPRTRGGLLKDKRPITAIYQGPWSVKVGEDGVTRIVAYPEVGQARHVPWIAIFKGDILTQRIDAAELLISYEE